MILKEKNHACGEAEGERKKRDGREDVHCKRGAEQANLVVIVEEKKENTDGIDRIETP